LAQAIASSKKFFLSTPDPSWFFAMMYARSAMIAVFVPIALQGCSSGGGNDDALLVETPLVCDNMLQGTPPSDEAEVPTAEAYGIRVHFLDMEAVAQDMDAILSDSKECWPADGGDYGPFMVRLAWHCSGTYRNSDGKGGCAGGRMRFEPERSWPDNTNLDKARALIYPLKQKYGDALSWGDLFVLAGQRALIASGAPLTRMCYGRIDDKDGEASKIMDEPCDNQGSCSEPHGATTVGLIYVNPEGPNGVPDRAGSVADIRRTFGTMGHSDRATVALVGGGHTIGKAHGACEAGAGQSPNEAFATEADGVIWQGECGTGAMKGKGENTVTSGFEGAWTTNPFTWDNEFFVESLASAGNQWTVHKGPGGKHQWKPAGNPDKNIFRLTADLALLEDDSYRTIVEEFAANETAFNVAFDEAWFKLTTNGGGWSAQAKCDDGSTPPPASAERHPESDGPRRMRGDDAPAVIV